MKEDLMIALYIATLSVLLIAGVVFSDCIYEKLDYYTTRQAQCQ